MRKKKLFLTTKVFKNISLICVNLNYPYSIYSRVEKCGFYGVWSQSKYNPTTKYEITLNGKTRQTEGVLFMKGRNVWFEGFLKAHAEPQEYERHYKMSVFMDNKLVPGKFIQKSQFFCQKFCLTKISLILL